MKDAKEHTAAANPVEAVGPAERVEYPEEQRAADMATLLEIMGGAPDPKALELALKVDEAFAARRSAA